MTAKWLPDCQDVSRLLSTRMDEQLPATERARLRLHLVMCDACRNVDAQLAFLRRAVRALGREPGDGPPAPPR